MKTDMLRSFLPIGHGGFAVEQFRTHDKDNELYNIVFDCGTKSSKSILKKQIELTFDKKEEIQKVFVSHLHDDHFNGLPYLLKYCRVKEVYLPYLTKSEQVMTLIASLETLNYEDAAIFQDLITGRNNSVREFETIIRYVVPRGKDIQQGNDMVNTYPSGKEMDIYTTNSDDDKWILIPYTFDYEENSIRFHDILKKAGINEIIQDQILNERFWEKDSLFKKMMNAYSQIHRNINWTSMIVYSGKKNDNQDSLCVERSYKSTSMRMNKGSMGCLYMGDYQASQDENWGQLKTAYSKVWKGIDVFTVPHHGSIHNFHDGLVQGGNDYIINARYSNDHSHPDQEVLRKLICNQCTVHWVNECQESMVSFEYTI